MMTGRGRRKYFEVKLDPELEEQTQAIVAMYPGHWPSLRALVQEIYRRGLREFLRTEAMKTAAAGPVRPEDPPGPLTPSRSAGETASASSIRAREARRDRGAPGPGRVARQDEGPIATSTSRAPSSVGRTGEITRTTFEAPKVKCPRCGELVQTTAEARAAHFKKCPPDGAPSEDGLVEEIRTRILSRAGDQGEDDLDAGLGRSLQIANVKEIAVRQGITIDDSAAARLLDRARVGWEAGRKERLTSKAGDTP